MRRWSRELILLIILLAGLDWWQSRSLRKGSLPVSFRNAPFETLDGQSLLPWSREHYTIVYVFAPWCGVCKMSARNLNRFLSPDLHVVSLVLGWEQPGDVEGFVRETGLKTPVLLGKSTQGEELGIESYPSYLLVNPRGEIVRAWTGYTSTLGLYIKLAAVKIIQGDISI